MANLTYAEIEELMKPHDTRYRWPDRTCLHPILDLIRHIIGEEPPSRYYESVLNWSESKANEWVTKHHKASWLWCVIDYLESHNIGHRIDVEEARSGDLIEFTSMIMRPVSSIGSDVDGIIGFQVNDSTLFLRASAGIIPISKRLTQPRLAARIERCIKCPM